MSFYYMISNTYEKKLLDRKTENFQIFYVTEATRCRRRILQAGFFLVTQKKLSDINDQSDQVRVWNLICI